MSQAFLNGFRASRGMGMGDVRTPQMRGGDQANTVSGNPGLAYNMPRMNTGAIVGGTQQMQANDQNMFAAQQQAMQGMPQQAQMRGGMGGMSADRIGQAMGNPQFQQLNQLGFGGQQQPSKPMRVRMPNFGQQLQNVQPVGGPNGAQQGQMPVQMPQRARYARPVMSSINNQGRRVYAQ